MAFGINRKELEDWKQQVSSGEIAFITHFWVHPRFEGITSVTKVGCNDVHKLVSWGRKYGLQEQWIHKRNLFPHFDLIGEKQLEVLNQEGQWEQLKRFF
ncbi:hypothetical protein [Sutcliffiella rhizosphaerae]|uniref:Uncharacterized protein n=1 Tax=Sutcliffiella rhizosphaerae TaxID=2880967 RepID=A0ABN8AD39_9BACI|nr:hypothetical protein [Sutcliffiella rhizosphaerae]CAG9621891.1 hypothetical protein BACCIP111883_02682 [Sutcliffiella rhizosphaerae]